MVSLQVTNAPFYLPSPPLSTPELGTAFKRPTRSQRLSDSVSPCYFAIPNGDRTLINNEHGKSKLSEPLDLFSPHTPTRHPLLIPPKFNGTKRSAPLHSTHSKENYAVELERSRSERKLEFYEACKTPPPLKRGVVFNQSPLASINSSPRHAFHPYDGLSKRSTTTVYSRRKRTCSPDQFNGSSLYSNNFFREGSPIATRSSQLLECLGEDDEANTDDEAEGNIVEQLLLPQSLSFSSPLKNRLAARRRFRIATKSILKKTSHPILRAQSAIEGSKSNAGRTKHMLSFADCLPKQNSKFLGVALRQTSRAAAEGTTNSERLSFTGDGTSESSGSTSSGKRRLDQVENQGVGGSKGHGEGEGDRTAESAHNEQLANDDPRKLEAPLITLRASLQASTSRIRQPTDSTCDGHASMGTLPRTYTSQELRSEETKLAHLSPMSEMGSPSGYFDNRQQGHDQINPFARRILLNEVEYAYRQLTIAFVCLPEYMEDPERSLAPITAYRHSLLRCLRRDISNITSFPAYADSMSIRNSNQFGDSFLAPPQINSSPNGDNSSSPLKHHTGKPAKAGLSDSLMRRQKDEIATALAAIKCAASIMQRKELSKLFSDEELHSLLHLTLKIPGTPGLSYSVQKDVYPFIAWLISVQDLLPSMLDAHLPQVLACLNIVLSTPDKLRSNLGEGISLVKKMLETHPAFILSHWQIWFNPVVEALWDAPKRNMVIKVRALLALCSLVQCLRLPSREQSHFLQAIELKSYQNAIADQMIQILHRIVAEPDVSNLTRLMQQLEAHFPSTGLEIAWVLNVLALLPVLLGSRFKIIEKKGIRPWLALVSKCREHKVEEVRLLINLAWPHLVYAFCQTAIVADPPPVLWILQDKPLAIILQFFSQQKAVYNHDSIASEYHRSKAIGLAQSLAATVSALTMVPILQPKAPNSGIVQAPNVTWLKRQYDVIWHTVIATEVTAAMGSVFQEAAVIGWRIFAQFVTGDDRIPEDYHMESMINLALLDGENMRAKDALQLVHTNALVQVHHAQFPIACMNNWLQDKECVAAMNVLINGLGGWNVQGSASSDLFGYVLDAWRGILFAYGKTEASTVSPMVLSSLQEIHSLAGNGKIPQTLIERLVLDAIGTISEAELQTLLDCSQVTSPSLYGLAKMCFCSSGDPTEIVQHAEVLKRFSSDTRLELYVAMLENLEITVARPDSALLRQLTPLLAPTLKHAFEVQTSQHQERHSLKAIVAFHEFWRKTFDRATDDLDIDEDMADLLSVIRQASDGGLVLANLGDTQGPESLIDESFSFEHGDDNVVIIGSSQQTQSPYMPAPAQMSQFASPMTTRSTHTTEEPIEVVEGGYDADTSRFRPNSSTSSPLQAREQVKKDNKGKKIDFFSPSLRAPAEEVITAEEEEVHEANSLSQGRRVEGSESLTGWVEETPDHMSKSMDGATFATAETIEISEDSIVNSPGRSFDRPAAAADKSTELDNITTDAERPITRPKSLRIRKRPPALDFARVEMPVKRRRKQTNTALQDGTSESTAVSKLDHPSTTIESNSTPLKAGVGSEENQEDLHEQAVIMSSPPLTASNASSQEEGEERTDLLLKEEDLIAMKLMTASVDNIVRATRRVGGTAGVQKLIELGERAKVYFGRLSQRARNSPPRR